MRILYLRICGILSSISGPPYVKLRQCALSPRNMEPPSERQNQRCYESASRRRTFPRRVYFLFDSCCHCCKSDSDETDVHSRSTILHFSSKQVCVPLRFCFGPSDSSSVLPARAFPKDAVSFVARTDKAADDRSREGQNTGS